MGPPDEDEEDRPEGYTLIEAARRFLTEVHEQILAASLHFALQGYSFVGDNTSPAEREARTQHDARVVLRFLVARFGAGELKVTGIPAGKTQPEPIALRFFDSATADFKANSVTSYSATYHATRWFAVAAVTYAAHRPIALPRVSLPRTGPRPDVSTLVEAAMRGELAAKTITYDQLANLKKKQLKGRFGGGPTTCWTVRRKIILETATNCDQTPSKDK